MNLPPEVAGALLGRRVVFLRGRLDDALATSVTAQLLLAAQMDSVRPIEVYIDSPGGAIEAALMLYDVFQTLSAPVSTTCLGTAGGAAVLLLAAGAPGRRAALPHARIHLTQEHLEVPAGTAGTVASQADQAVRTRARWQAALVNHIGHSAQRLDRDLTAGTWLSAAEARDYGLVDGIHPGQPTGEYP
jgi:ATP-dependent Clp protease, protease subunit